MTNEEAIQILKPFRDMMVDQHGCPISDAVPALDLAISALSRDRWISVNDSLPEPRTDVLAAWDDGEVWSLWQSWANSEEDNPFTYFIDPIEGTTHYVTHWMPLPEPPKEET